MVWSSVVTLSLTCKSRNVDSPLTLQGHWSNSFDVKKTKKTKQVNLIKVQEAVNKKILRQKMTEEPWKLWSISSPDCWKTGSRPKKACVCKCDRSGRGSIYPSSFSWFRTMMEHRLLGRAFLLALHWAEEGALDSHEALAHQTLGAAGALEAVWLGVPVVLAVRHPLGFGLHRLLARRTFLERDDVFRFIVIHFIVMIL